MNMDKHDKESERLTPHEVGNRESQEWDTCQGCGQKVDVGDQYCPRCVDQVTPNATGNTEPARDFEEHVTKMDRTHPDWLKGNHHGATSLMAVAREFWDASVGRAKATQPQRNPDEVS